MIVEGVGCIMTGYAVVWGIHTKINNDRDKAKLRKVFIDGELFKTIQGRNKTYKQYPKIIEYRRKEDVSTFVFSVPKGVNPEKFEKALYVFKQHFGKYLKLNMDEKRGVFQVYPKGLPTKFKYDLDIIKESCSKHKLPIVCGQSLEGETFAFNLVENPHMLIAGETGSGKSSAIRSILTTLVNVKKPNELRLVLGDLKRSEFHLFKNLRHVDCVCHSAETLRPHLKKVKKEMTKRGNMSDEKGVNSIDELKAKIPYIIVCIDEVVLLKKETDIMDILEEISSIGRSLGVFLIISMQRPDSKLLDGKLKVNLTVRMGFKTQDTVNSKIIGTPGSEKLTNAGRMLLKINSDMKEIQCPLLENNKAKKLLQPFKLESQKCDTKTELQDANTENYKEVMELFSDE